MAESNNLPLVTNVQGWSIQDGPGIRTTVFLKGCPMRCMWCHNPECIHPYAEIYYKKIKCTQCGMCYPACPEGAIYPPIPPDEAAQEDNKYYKIDLERCTRCMKCVEVCPNGALVRVGDPVPVEEILHEVEREFMFYLNSGGGLTLSGGEPTTQVDYVLKILKGAKDFAGVHTCLDTCGMAKWEHLEALLPYVSLFLYDIKHMDPAKHIIGTGAPNDVILKNAERLAEAGAALNIRLVIVPDYNDSEENIERVAKFAKSLGDAVKCVDLLPFHNYCDQKYRWLGKMDWELADVQALTKADVAPLEEIIKSYGLETTIGG